MGGGSDVDERRQPTTPLLTLNMGNAVGIESKYPREAVELFKSLLGLDEQLACDALMRHYRGEYWPGRRGRMPPLRRIPEGSLIKLPAPRPPALSVGDAIIRRRSAEDFTPGPIDLNDLATILYLTIGITAWTEAYGLSKYPLRAYPSAGALQPVEAYVYANYVNGLDKGIYKYDAFTHSLIQMKVGDFAKQLVDISLGQDHVGKASAVLILTVYYARTRWKYWKRALRYVLLDAGAAMENAYLASVGLGLGVRAVGAFYDNELCSLLSIDCLNEFPVVLILVGRPA